jgi:tetratricopeptide (TPR) repeat protein
LSPQQDCNIVTNSHSDDPDFQFSHILKGGIYIYLEKFDKALYEFNYLLKINPDSAWGYVCKSELYCRWGKYQKSLENAQIALSMDSSIEIVYVWRAWAYYELEKIEEALEDCNFCVQNKVDNPKPFEILGLINESKNNLPEALKFFIKAKNLYENNQYEKTRYKKQYDETIQAINNIQVRLDKES